MRRLGLNTGNSGPDEGVLESEKESEDGIETSAMSQLEALVAAPMRHVQHSYHRAGTLFA